MTCKIPFMSINVSTSHGAIQRNTELFPCKRPIAASREPVDICVLARRQSQSARWSCWDLQRGACELHMLHLDTYTRA